MKELLNAKAGKIETGHRFYFGSVGDQKKCYSVMLIIIIRPFGQDFSFLMEQPKKKPNSAGPPSVQRQWVRMDRK